MDDGRTHSRCSEHDRSMIPGFMYILECANGAYYTGSTRDVFARLRQHQRGEGSSYTRIHAPVRLVYYEEYEWIDEAFYREKQVQDMLHSHKQKLVREGWGVRPE